jgi:hypothetical protein
MDQHYYDHLQVRFAIIFIVHVVNIPLSCLCYVLHCTSVVIREPHYDAPIVYLVLTSSCLCSSAAMENRLDSSNYNLPLRPAAMPAQGENLQTS